MNPDVIRWLESPAGMAWSHATHKPITKLAEIKDDLLPCPFGVALWLAGFNDVECMWETAA